MNKRLCCACVAITLVAAPCYAAGQSWNGTWKVNLAKSKVTEDAFSVEDKGSGMMRYAGGGQAYDIACDGKAYPTGDGQTDTCTGSLQSGYDDVIKNGNKVVQRQHSVFSADGKTLTINEAQIGPDGKTKHGTAVYERISGTTGFVGKWQMEFMSVIEVKGDWIKIYDPLTKMSREGKMDGSALKETGTNVTPEVTRSIKMETPNKLLETIKLNGKITTESIQTLSADGKTFIEETWAPGKEKEKTTWVWERQ